MIAAVAQVHWCVARIMGRFTEGAGPTANLVVEPPGVVANLTSGLLMRFVLAESLAA